MSEPKPTVPQAPKPNMISEAINTDLQGLVRCHLPRFSYKHGMIPNLYVMPWKQDMKYRKIKLKHAGLVGLYSGAPEDTLFLDRSERHCHGEDRKQLLLKVPMQMTIADIPIYSHLSRYHKSIVACGFRLKL